MVSNHKGSWFMADMRRVFEIMRERPKLPMHLHKMALSHQNLRFPLKCLLKALGSSWMRRSTDFLTPKEWRQFFRRFGAIATGRFWGSQWFRIGSGDLRTVISNIDGQGDCMIEGNIGAS